MHELSDGMNIDPTITIQVLQNKLAQHAVRDAQLEAAVQQLMGENAQLRAELDGLRPGDTEKAEQE